MRRASGGVLLAVLAVARPVGAEPQVSVGVTVGAAGEGFDHRMWTRRTAFHLGLHGDLVLGRSSTSSFGVGPYVELLTHAFDEVELGGGVSGLLPVLDTFPVIVSAGVYGRKGPEGFGLEPGVAGEICWGPRSYNFHSRYVLSGGLLGQVRYGLGPTREMSIVVAAQVDIMVLAIPVLFLINAARGSSPEAAPLR
jgi:hypothetical protein